MRHGAARIDRFDLLGAARHQAPRTARRLLLVALQLDLGLYDLILGLENVIEGRLVYKLGLGIDSDPDGGSGLILDLEIRLRNGRGGLLGLLGIDCVEDRFGEIGLIGDRDGDRLGLRSRLVRPLVCGGGGIKLGLNGKSPVLVDELARRIDHAERLQNVGSVTNVAGGVDGQDSGSMGRFDGDIERRVLGRVLGSLNRGLAVGSGEHLIDAHGHGRTHIDRSGSILLDTLGKDGHRARLVGSRDRNGARLVRRECGGRGEGVGLDVHRSIG